MTNAITTNRHAIYVASLNAYNEGRLFGKWFDLSDYEDEEQLMKDIFEMLAKDNPEAEEWAIHDTDGMGHMIGEYSSLKKCIAIAHALDMCSSDEEEDALLQWMEDGSLNDNADAEDIYNDFIDDYVGTYNSEEDFAIELMEDTGEINRIPEHLQAYFDYEAYAGDLFINDYWSARTPEYQIHVYRRS